MSDAHSEAFRPDGFGRKVGPLPIWGWALVLAAGVYIFYRFYAGRNASAGASGSAIDQSYATNGSNPSTSPYAGTSDGNGTGSLFGSFYSNDAYNAAAIGEASQFGATPLDVQAALAAYESGANLTPTQGGIINQILGAFGGLPSAPPSTSQIVSPSTPDIYHVQAANALDTVFGGQFTDSIARLGGDASSSRQTAINTWANRIQAGESPAQAVAQMESGPTYAAYKAAGGK